MLPVVERAQSVAACLAIACVASVGCGGSDPSSACGDRGAEQRVGGFLFCVYDEEVVSGAGGSLACPERAPVRVEIGGAVVCTSDATVVDPGDLPASVCVGLPMPCGRAGILDGSVPDGSSGDVTAPDAGDAAMTDAGPEVDLGPGGCPPLDARREVEVSGDVTTDETWGCDRTYRMVRNVWITAGATLTIQPSVLVRADPGAALVALADGRLDAVGTATAPIVMTSSAAVGTRRAGEWLGVALLGRAPVVGGVRSFVEDPRLPYGGDVPAHDCGRLRYVRIEFAGSSVGRPGLALMACGTRTSIDHVQVHVSADNGIDLRGGTVDLSHVVVTSPIDSGIDWDRGWTGRAQFVVVQSLASAADRSLLHGFSRDLPRSSPHIENATLVSVGPGRHHIGIHLENGTDATIRNTIVWGAYDAAFDLVDAEEVNRVTAEPPGVEMSHAIFFGMGDDAAAYFTREQGPPDYPGDGDFDDAGWVADPSRSNRFGADPLLPLADSIFAPGWVPPIGSPAMSGAATPPADDFFDASARYVGAFEPGGPDWTAGWTSYPGS